MIVYALILVSVWGETMETVVINENLSFEECEMLDNVLTPMLIGNAELLCEVVI